MDWVQPEDKDYSHLSERALEKKPIQRERRMRSICDVTRIETSFVGDRKKNASLNRSFF